MRWAPASSNSSFRPSSIEALGVFSTPASRVAFETDLGLRRRPLINASLKVFMAPFSLSPLDGGKRVLQTGLGVRFDSRKTGRAVMFLAGLDCIARFSASIASISLKPLCFAADFGGSALLARLLALRAGSELSPFLVSASATSSGEEASVGGGDEADCFIVVDFCCDLVVRGFDLLDFRVFFLSLGGGLFHTCSGRIDLNL